MKSGKLLKSALSFAMAAAMVVGLVIPAVTEVKAATNENGYEAHVVYEMDENEFAAKGEPASGYAWDYIQTREHVDGYVDYNQLTCTAEEHTHADATAADCLGWAFTCAEAEHTHSEYAGACYVQNTCNAVEHTHASATATDCQGCVLVCTQEEHEHDFACGEWFFGACKKWEHEHGNECYTQNVCELTEHTHASATATDCQGWVFTCEATEHTHSGYAGTCYTQNVCEKAEHVHNDNCYVYVEPVLAMYKCRMIEAGSTNVGDGSIQVYVTVKCADGTPIPGANVAVTLDKIWSSGSDTMNVSTNMHGQATVNASVWEYNYVSNVTAQIGTETVVISDKKEFVSAHEDEAVYSYTIPNHNYVIDATTVVEPTLADNGYSGDYYCAYCGNAGEKGNVVERTGAYVTFEGMYGATEAVTVLVGKGTTLGAINGKPEGVTYYEEINGECNEYVHTGWKADGNTLSADSVITNDVTVVAEYTGAVVEHDYSIVENTSEEPGVGVDGYEGDKVCDNCGYETDGEVIPYEEVRITFTGMIDKADVEEIVERGTTFENINKPELGNYYFEEDGKYMVSEFEGWNVAAETVVDTNVTVEAVYATAKEDTRATFYMPGGMIEKGELAKEEEILSRYTKTVMVGEEEITYQWAESEKTYTTTVGWTVVVDVKDIAGSDDAEKMSYVFFCDEKGKALLDENDEVVYRVVETGSELSDLPTAPAKKAYALYTYSFNGWYVENEKVTFEEVTDEIMVVSAGYKATSRYTASDDYDDEEEVIEEAPATVAEVEEDAVVEIEEEETPLAAEVEEDVVVEIEEEETPLAAGTEEAVEIEEEETPLAAGSEKAQMNFWWLLLLLIPVCYIVYRNTKKQEAK